MATPALANPHWLRGSRESLTSTCCRLRPWEAAKYESRDAQDANLAYLLSWVTDYYGRDGQMSLQAHEALFARYSGRKVEFRTVPELVPPAPDVLALLG